MSFFFLLSSRMYLVSHVSFTLLAAPRVNLSVTVELEESFIICTNLIAALFLTISQWTDSTDNTYSCR